MAYKTPGRGSPRLDSDPYKQFSLSLPNLGGLPKIPSPGPSSRPSPNTSRSQVASIPKTNNYSLVGGGDDQPSRAITYDHFPGGYRVTNTETGETQTWKYDEEGGVYQVPNAPTAPTGDPGGDTETDDGSPLDLSQLASRSRSYTGPPPWLMEILNNLGTNFAENSFGDFRGAIKRLDEAPANIETARKGMVNKYVEGIQAPLSNMIQGAVGRAAGKGTLGSSMTGDALGRIGQTFERGAQDVHRDTNIWAENQLLANMLNRIQAQGAFNQSLGSFLNMSRYGQSESTNPNLAQLIPLITGNVG